MPNELSPNDNLAKIKVALQVLRHAESKSDLDFELSLFLKVFSLSMLELMTDFAGFGNTPSFWLKRGNQLQSIIKNKSEKE